MKLDSSQLKADSQQLSTWYFNGIAISAFLIVSLAGCFLMFICGTELSPTVLSRFVMMAFICASWANVGLGQKIGWDRGGLPVVLIAASIATFIYSVLVLLVCGCIYIVTGIAFSN